MPRESTMPRRYISHNRNVWMPLEDAALIRMREQKARLCYDTIANRLGHSASSCRSRYSKLKSGQVPRPD